MSPKLIVILILKGDIITEIDGKKIKDDVDLRSYLYENKNLVNQSLLPLSVMVKQRVKVKLKQQKNNQNVKADQNVNHPGQGDRDFFR